MLTITEEDLRALGRQGAVEAMREFLVSTAAEAVRVAGAVLASTSSPAPVVSGPAFALDVDVSAASVADGGREWLELTWEVPRRASSVRIHEVYVSGAVVEVHVRTSGVPGSGRRQLELRPVGLRRGRRGVAVPAEVAFARG